MAAGCCRHARYMMRVSLYVEDTPLLRSQLGYMPWRDKKLPAGFQRSVIAGFF
jgi:hypothetical protein